MWSHREQLLRVARKRSVSIEDAEDAVHEAMVRAAERPHLDAERLGAWLTSVTIRLCVDRYRQMSRDARVALRHPIPAGPWAGSPEETVCELAEAKWLALKSTELPGRQAEALRLRAQNLDVEQVAQRMGLTYKAVESLLGRARRTLRAVLAGTLALAVGLWRGRPRVEGGAPAAALASAAATLVITGLALVSPFVGDGAASAPPPAPPMSGSVAHPAPYDDSRGPSLPNEPAAPSVEADTPHAPSRPPTQPASHRRTDSGPTRMTAASPEPLPLPAAPVPVPVVPVPGLPEARLPEPPAVPAVSPPPAADLSPGLPGIPELCSRSLNCGAGRLP
ncbi:sigma-70 family RNA polymerase sigma factor [Streptomyces sp. NPDC049837]|uniref:RNA polymerase sigma factor n=1 Tax=Streptomyces sp. NPDC049837 TaxID=3155277 RepID=UPI003435068F